MKTFINKAIIYTFLTFGFLLAFSLENKAQILKKLKQKAESRMEKSTTDKKTDNADKENSKAMHKMLDPEMMKKSSMAMGFESGNLADVPDSYQFDWVYVMSVTTARAEDKLLMEYLLRSDATYWGFKMNQDMEMTIVYDLSNKLTVVFMNNEGKSHVSVTKIHENMLDGIDEEDSEFDYTINEISGKEILGYSCKGYLIEDDEYKLTMYVAPDAEVRLGNIYNNNQQFSNAMPTDWLGKDITDGLMMEMHMVDKKKPKNNTTMECVKLKKQYNEVNKSDYQGM
ncbi:DUF4412 domain-containing protein [Saccharicrinis carchari]|nr:DUF4412 domain-containing protein [Saccharicrinis carchari]